MRCDLCYNNAYKQYVITSKETDEIEDVSYLCDGCAKTLLNDNLLEEV